jgi:hypothetical protein
MPTLRARESVAVTHPDTGLPVPVVKHQPIDPDDPLVRAFPWLFGEDEPMESASARPGERRQR